jgi:hypothetical protein
VDNENGRPPEPDEVPVAYKTANQIVAWNIAYYRKVAGLTQEELGTLTGRSKRNMSADERSWDGSHTREFNAHELVTLATALGLPVAAFFLPPDDDGISVRYRLTIPGSYPDDLDMQDMTAIASPDSAFGGEVMQSYRDRLTAAAERYMDPPEKQELLSWLFRAPGPQERASRIDGVRQFAESLTAMAAIYGEVIAEAEKLEDSE